MVERADLRRFRRGAATRRLGAAGTLGRPTLAPAEKGKQLYERILARVATRVLGVPVEPPPDVPVAEE
jgi:creatinine amidohydrolase/Fe(II)-dependent formamide hydrolase-like protein